MLCQNPFIVKMAQPRDIKLGTSSRQRPSPMEPTAVDDGAMLYLLRWQPWDSWRKQRQDLDGCELQAPSPPQGE